MTGARLRMGASTLLLAASALGCVATPRPAAQQPAPKRPAAAAEQSCIALKPQFCADVLAAAKGWTAAEVAGYRIQCDTPTCKDDSGSLWANILWSDGSRTDQGFGWGNGWSAAGLRDAFKPLPTPLVPATCVAVPDDQCQKAWNEAMAGLSDDAQIANIVFVRIDCTTTCTDALGEVRTTVGFRDGTTLLIGIYSYGVWIVSPSPA